MTTKLNLKNLNSLASISGKGEFNTNNSANLTPIVTLPIQNKQDLYTIKDSTIPSLITYFNNVKTSDNKTKGRKEKFVKFLTESTITTQYLQNSKSLIPSDLTSGMSKIFNIKNDTESFKTFKPNLDEVKYYALPTYKKESKYLIKTLTFIKKYSTNPKDKNFINRLIVRILFNKEITKGKKVFYRNYQNALSNTRPFTSPKIRALLPYLLPKLEKYRETNQEVWLKGHLERLEHKILGLSTDFRMSNLSSYPLLWYDYKFFKYFKKGFKYPIYLYLDLFRALKKKYRTIFYLLDNIKLPLGSFDKKYLMTKKNFIKSINPFDLNLAHDYNLMFNFNKKNNYNIFKNRNNIEDILEAAFFSMDSLISKIFLEVEPTKIVINLYFFWKPSQESQKILSKRKTNILLPWEKNNRHKGIMEFILPRRRGLYLGNKFSRFAYIFVKNLKSLSLILTKLLKKTVDFEITRIYYPYKDSNILAFFLGFLSFWVKFFKVHRRIRQNVTFSIKRKRMLKLKVQYIPSAVTGITIKLNGRLAAVRAKRRANSKIAYWGSLARSNNKLKMKSRMVLKNVAGAYTYNIFNNSTVFN